MTMLAPSLLLLSLAVALAFATGLIDETAKNCPLDVITLWDLQP